MSTAVAVPVTQAPSRSPSAILVRKLFRRKLVLAGAAILVVVTLLALFAPWITPFGPMTMKISDRMQSPRLAHWFGTDEDELAPKQFAYKQRRWTARPRFGDTNRGKCAHQYFTRGSTTR